MKKYAQNKDMSTFMEDAKDILDGNIGSMRLKPYAEFAIKDNHDSLEFFQYESKEKQGDDCVL